MSYTIGIDLGTTNSCVAVVQNNNPVVIPNSEGQRTTPSIVAFTPEHEKLIGENAKHQAITNSKATIASIKRKMGTNYTTYLDDKELSPQEVSAMILKKLKDDAESFLGEEVKDAVITVPAYFNDAQRQATKDAGLIAGLNVKRIINEPTAAAIAYGLDNAEDQKVLVYDLGGGTFDVSVISIGDGVIEVLATSGNNKLGGDDFDKIIMEWIAGEFYKREKINLKNDVTAMQRVKEAAEDAKRTLTHANSAQINLPFLAVKDNEPKHLNLTLSKNKFNELTKKLVDKTEIPVNNALEDAGLKPSDISKVLLVGGSTRIPAIQEKVKQMIGKNPSKTLNPDECVAIGAAIQGANISGHESFDLVLLDVTPLTLSVETSDGIANHLIERNTTIPTTATKIYTTAEDNQDNIGIKVVQGERLFAKDNVLIGEFILDGILPAKKGIPKIEITFNIDVDGILEVKAKDLRTKRENTIKITNSIKLSEEEIQKAIMNASKYEEEDRLFKSISDEKNNTYDLIDRINMALENNNIEIDKKNRELLTNTIDEYLEFLMKKNTSKDYHQNLIEKNRSLEQLFIDIFGDKETEDIETTNENNKKFYSQF